MGSAKIRGMADCLIYAHPHMCYSAEFCHSRSNSANITKEIHLIYLTPPVPPFKVTQSHWNRHIPIGCVRLPINVI